MGETKAVNASTITLSSRASGKLYNGGKLFTTRNGDDVFRGDIVEFTQEGDIFPTVGTVSNYSGLRVECFNQLLNKWRYYNINENK